MDEAKKNIIKATVPVLAQHGEAITKTFYKNMFAAHPELLNIFNITNQARGRQPRALAGTILAAATHIDDLSAILPAVNLIAHKHVALGIKKEHYPIVGENLLKAIKEVLNVGDDILDAWGTYYGIIAQVFIDYEENLYQTIEKSVGGWRGLKDFVVQKKVVESDNVASFYLVPKEGGDIPSFVPGQYITLRSSIPEQEYVFNRHYSISDTTPGTLRISVKKLKGNPDGVYSNYIHDHVKEGDVLQLNPPTGEFVLRNPNKANIFLAGGIGITPILSMVKSIKNNDNVTLCYSVRSKSEYPFAEEINQLKSNDGFKYHLISSDESIAPNHVGRVNRQWIQDNVLDLNADYYVSGPDDYNRDVVHALRASGVPEGQIFYEFFGPKVDLSTEQ